jgi:hypothetical protein
MKAEYKIIKVADGIRNMLLKKNKAYGNSALSPVNIFSKQSAVQSLSARIDDKLARISNSGVTDETEDTLHDLCGYLILLIIALENDKEQRDVHADA